jgi:RNA polymerase sigma-70 factor (ECF subfamily)
MQQDEAVQKQGELAWLSRAMSSLPNDLRQTVTLVLGEDLTHAQAAHLLEISEGTVSWRMSQVKKKLRAMALEEEKTYD